MSERFSRTEMIYGKDNMNKLYGARVAVFGIGGVGGYITEALARSGIGQLDLFDHDRICISNINRQIHATEKTIGMYKVDAAAERIRDINPAAVVNTYKVFYLPETSPQVNLSQYDYVADAIDTVAGKIELAVRAFEYGTPIISSMGAGNKLNAAGFEVADIYQTQVCPLAKVMRSELRRRGIPKLKVVYSKERPVPLQNVQDVQIALPDKPDEKSRKQVPGSNAYVPAAAGLIIAGEIISDLLRFDCGFCAQKQ